MTAVDVQARIAMLGARVGVPGAGHARGGGRVGSGMQQALAAAAAAAAPDATVAASAAASAGATAGPATTLGVAIGAPGAARPTPSVADPTTSSTTPVGTRTTSPPPAPAASTPDGAVPAWAARLPAGGARFAPAIAAAARKHGLDERLLAALVWTESAFDPTARSGAGAIGLGQLMPGTAAELGVDPHDPVQNLDGAARYLATQLDRFGDVRLALAAYNAGPGRVAAAGGVPAIEETTNYVARVTGRHSMLGG